MSYYPNLKEEIVLDNSETIAEFEKENKEVLNNRLEKCSSDEGKRIVRFYYENGMD